MKNKKIRLFLTGLSILVISYLGVWVRLATINSPTVLDYDPWWFYRYAEMILKNDLKPPVWDYQSFYPPGRPITKFLGWPYTIIFFYKIFQLFEANITLMKAAILSPLIIVALIPIPAYLLGKQLSNEIGGIVTALFAVLAPSFIGVSMAGYCDTDAPIVFYFFLSILSTLYCLRKRTIPSILFAILSNFLFIFNWGGGWIVLILFTSFLAALPIFRVIENFFHSWKLKLDIKPFLPEVRSIFLPLITVILVTNLLGYLFFQATEFHSLLGGLSFTGLVGTPLLVNRSVAELQPINVFSREGFYAIALRVGFLPTFLTLFGLPFLILYKLWKKEKISIYEIFFFLFAFSMFYLISRGVRFSLQFSVAAAMSSGYVLGNIVSYFRRIDFLKNEVVRATSFGVLALLFLQYVSYSIQVGKTSSMLISKNWYDALDWIVEHGDERTLVATWWDPGHILAGYSYYKGKLIKVHADGAHCPPEECIPYNHNIRIRDMGRIFSTSNETEAIEILKKYVKLKKEDCEKAKQKYSFMPEDACEPIRKVYVIASNDLIGKYYWLSYFGSYDETKDEGEGRNYLYLHFTSYHPQTGIIEYHNGVLKLVIKNDTLIPILNIPMAGIRNQKVKNIVYYEGERRVEKQVENATYDGLVWVDPSFQVAILMDSKVYKSIFTNMYFFDGKGSESLGLPKLEKFKLVFSNPEVKIFEAIF